MMPVNPYIAGKPVGGSKAFAGRANILRDVIRILRSPHENALLLHGQPRIGKTSILKELIAQLSKHGSYLPVFLDSKNKMFISPSQIFAGFTGLWENDFRGGFLPRILDQMPHNSSLVILCDECTFFERTPGAAPAYTDLASLPDLLTTDPQRLQFIFVTGRHPKNMSPEELSILKEIKSRPILLLMPEETAELVRLAERNNSLRWPDESVEYVYHLTGGHPLLTHQLCQEIWERSYLDDPIEVPTIRPEDVEAAVPQALHSAAIALEWVWGKLEPAERILAAVMAATESDVIQQSELEQRLRNYGIRIISDKLNTASQVLEEWEIISNVKGGYRFNVELFRRWIATNKTLEQVHDDINRLEPVAYDLFQRAYESYRIRQFDEAIAFLQQAISLNPNHTQAILLLAEIFLARNQADNARRLLETIYEHYPAARCRLVQTLLIQAQDAVDQERLNLYSRVLSIDPGQVEALRGLEEIWKTRGDEALAAGELDQASHAYQQAGLSEKVFAVGLQQLAKLEESRTDRAALDLAKHLYEQYPSERDRFPDLWLARILLDYGEVTQAVRLLESLYDDCPDVVRPSLVRGLLQQAEVLIDADEQLGIFERVLRIEPGQPEATAGRQAIWIHRGEVALANNDIGAALLAYGNADLPEKVEEIKTALRLRHLKTKQQEFAQLAREKKYDEALELARQLHTSYPENQEILPELAILERKVRLDHLYQQALEALRNDDQQKAQDLLANVVAMEPGYGEATRYLHLVVSGIDVAELQNQLEMEHKARTESETLAQRESSLRRQLEAELEQSQNMLATEKVSRLELEAIVQEQITARRQREAELKQLQKKLEAERHTRQNSQQGIDSEELQNRPKIGEDSAVFAREEILLNGKWEEETTQLKIQLELEQEARRVAEATARDSAESLDQFKNEIEHLQAQLDTVRKEAQQQVKFAAINARRQLRSQENRLEKQLNNEGKESIKPLSPWNPVSYLRLLWWSVGTPERLQVYRQSLGAESLHLVGKWLVSLLIWLPLFIPTLALGLGIFAPSDDAWPPDTYLWLSVGLVLASLFTGWLSGTDRIIVSLTLMSVSIVGAVGAANAVAVGFAVDLLNGLVIGGFSAVAFSLAVWVAFIVQGDDLKLGTVTTIGVAVVIAVSSVAMRIVYITTGVAMDIPISMVSSLVGSLVSSLVIGLAIWAGEKLSHRRRWLISLLAMSIVGIPGIVAGLTANLVSADLMTGVVFGIIFGLANAVTITVFVVLGALLDKRAYVERNGHSAWLARSSFGLLLIIHFFWGAALF